MASFWIGNLLLLLINIPLISIWVSLLNIPYRYLYPAIIVLICIGSYSISNNTFDVAMVLLFGVLGYLMRRRGFMPAPLLIGFVLSPLLEENLRRGMLMGRGDIAYFVGSPIAMSAWIVTILLLGFALFSGPIHAARQRRKRKTGPSARSRH